MSGSVDELEPCFVFNGETVREHSPHNISMRFRAPELSGSLFDHI
jgi:hypothetical protein